MPVELKERFEKVTDAVVTEGYGLTESSGVVSVNPYEGLNKSGTVGQPLPGTRIVLVDRADPDRPAPPGEPGEITFAGPQEIGRAHALTPVTTAHLVCRLLLEKTNKPCTALIHALA